MTRKINLAILATYAAASISDLKNNLSARLKAVIAGEPLVITDRRKPVAVVYPLEEDSMDDYVKSLVAEGVVIPPKRSTPLDVKALLSMPKGKSKTSLVEAILEERREGCVMRPSRCG